MEWVIIVVVLLAFSLLSREVRRAQMEARLAREKLDVMHDHLLRLMERNGVELLP